MGGNVSSGIIHSLVKMISSCLGRMHSFTAIYIYIYVYHESLDRLKNL